jgi:hypothetical protein
MVDCLVNITIEGHWKKNSLVSKFNFFVTYNHCNEMFSTEIFFLVCYACISSLDPLIYSKCVCLMQQVQWDPFKGKSNASHGIWFAKYESTVTIQHNFLNMYRRWPPSTKQIHHWFTQCKETGSMFKQKSSERPWTSEENAEWTRVPVCVKSKEIYCLSQSASLVHSNPQSKKCCIRGWN